MTVPFDIAQSYMTRNSAANIDKMHMRPHIKSFASVPAYRLSMKPLLGVRRSTPELRRKDFKQLPPKPSLFRISQVGMAAVGKEERGTENGEYETIGVRNELLLRPTCMGALCEGLD